MPLGNVGAKQSTGTKDRLDQAVLEAVQERGEIVFHELARAVAVLGDYQQTEAAILRLRRDGHVRINYVTGVISARESEAQ